MKLPTAILCAIMHLAVFGEPAHGKSQPNKQGKEPLRKTVTRK